MVERPGEVVSREELKARLWSDKTFVDFEDGISTAVRKVRAALGDNATAPRFIETVPKRGYRFSAPVSGSGSGRAVPALGSPGPAKWIGAAVGVAVAVAVVWLLVGSNSGVRSDEIYLSEPLTSYRGDEIQPSFSPDGAQVAFAWNRDGEYDIYVKSVGGESQRRLTDDVAADVAPAWSPDGRYIAFVRHGDPNDSVFLISPLGGAERKLVELDTECNPAKGRFAMAWSPDSKKLALPYYPTPDAPISIAEVEVEGGTLRDLPLPQVSRRTSLFGSYSLDGSSFVAAVHQSFLNADLVMIDLTGGHSRAVTRLGRDIRSLAWLRSGKEVVFSTRGPGAQIWVASVDGGDDPRPVRDAADDVYHVAAAQSRDLLAYSAQASEGRDIWQLEIGMRDFPEPSEIDGPLFESTVNEDQPRLSHDGTRVAFTSQRSGSRQIWTADADGSNLFQLTDLDAQAVGTARWSPDDRFIAFNTTLSGSLDIYVAASDGGFVRPLASSKFRDLDAAWAPDGWIYFCSDRTGRDEIWRTRLDADAAEQVTAEGGRSPEISPDGGTLFFKSLDGLRIDRRDLATGKTEQFLASPRPTARCFEAHPLGLYFAAAEEGAEPPVAQGELYRADYETGEVERVGTLDEPRAPVNCFSVSPDGRRLVYARGSAGESDLRLIRDFR